MVTRKPRYFEEMENGVLYFEATGNTHGKIWVIRGANN